MYFISCVSRIKDITGYFTSDASRAYIRTRHYDVYDVCLNPAGTSKAYGYRHTCMCACAYTQIYIALDIFLSNSALETLPW